MLSMDREVVAGDDSCLFHGYARWYAAAAGCLLPLSHLPILAESGVADYVVDRQEWSVWDLARQDQQGGLAAIGAYLTVSLFVLLVATAVRPAPRSGRRVVVIAILAALSAALLVTTPTTDDPLTGAGKAAAAMLIITAVLAADHALHLIRYRRRELLEPAREPGGGGTDGR